jgi:hypothetical protein
MALFRILYLKDSEVERFRHAAPKDKPDSLALKHYDEVGRIDAPSAYAAWKALQEGGAEERQIRPMGVGDVLEVEGEKPLLCHFWGFEEAEWRQPSEYTGPGSQARSDAERTMAAAGTETAG